MRVDALWENDEQPVCHAAGAACAAAAATATAMPASVHPVSVCPEPADIPVSAIAAAAAAAEEQDDDAAALPAFPDVPAREMPSVTFVEDVTVLDDTQVARGVVLEKTWRVINSGTKPWPEGMVVSQ